MSVPAAWRTGALAAFLLFADLAVAQPVSEPIPESMGLEDARHLLARTGFGPTKRDLEQFSSVSRERAIQILLAQVPAVASLPPPDWTDEAITPRSVMRNVPEDQRRALRLQENRLNNRRTFELRSWWIREMLATPAPLVERMTLFWHNHFTSSQQKVRFPQLMYLQNVLLRKHALGNFGVLLHAVSKDPAMVIYLDSASNRKGRPNENFSREVMELFTLGEGHYTEADVREAARAFTGWSIDLETGKFVNRRATHDPGEKTVLGRRGRFDGDDVLNILLAHPRTAESIVEKLWREFISPAPERREVQRIARVFRDSGYETRVALRELLLSPAFWSEDNRAVLVKSPAEFIVGALRQFEVPVADATPFTFTMAFLGQNLFAPPNVKGWPGGEAWINSATLLGRKQFVERLFRGEEMNQGSMDPAGMTGPGMVRPQGGRVDKVPADAPGVARRRAPAMPSFDTRWFSGFGGDRDPAIAQLVLAAPPANPAPDGLGGRTWLRHLALDPAYQLK